MQKSLTEKSQDIQLFVEQAMKDLWFYDMIKDNEKIEIVWSIKYGLAIEWESDVDIWIRTDDPRSSFIEKVNFGLMVKSVWLFYLEWRRYSINLSFLSSLNHLCNVTLYFICQNIHSSQFVVFGISNVHK